MGWGGARPGAGRPRGTPHSHATFGCPTKVVRVSVEWEIQEVWAGLEEIQMIIAEYREQLDRAKGRAKGKVIVNSRWMKLEEMIEQLEESFPRSAMNGG